MEQSAIHHRRQYRLKLPDALIMATAVCLKAELLTYDARLLNIPDLTAKSLSSNTSDVFD
ncbi:MAG: PIN domain-containing protein [Gammaproteobacteria bacterium]